MRRIDCAAVWFVAGWAGVGCCARVDRSTMPHRTHQPETGVPASGDWPKGWAAGLTPAQAKALPPGEAKAVLVARTAVEAEQDSRHLPNLEFRATPASDGWAVEVRTFGASEESITSPEGFAASFSMAIGNMSRLVR